MLQILEQADFDPQRLNVVAEMGSTDAIRQAVKAEVGVSILSRRAVADDLEFRKVRQISIKDISFTRHFYLVTHKRRSRSPLGEAFVDFLVENRDK
jgi:DNA-binding transcriptional LysR family regulator